MLSDSLLRLILGVFFLALVAVPAVAQIDEDTTDDEPDGVIEELVVVGTRPGNQVEADPVYRDLLRQQMMDEVERMRLEEENTWRDSNLNYRSSEESRIVWGYDPKADRDMRNDMDFDTMPGETVRPATLFRAEF